jgi:heptosyltransferase II
MKILIELPTWMGDTVMTTPAIENLINYFNNPKITLLGSFASTELIKTHPNVDKVYVLEKNYANSYKTLRMLGDFDLFLSFRGSFRAKILKYFISAQKKYQYNKNKYTNLHQVEKYNSFINESIDFKSSAGKLVLHEFKNNHKKDNKLLGINPGASYGSAKRWYPEEFANLAAGLSSQFDIVIFGGPGEIDIANDIEEYLKQKGLNNLQNLAGKTSIKELATQIAKLDLFVTGDSGPMHLAAAFQIPTVSIFGPTNEIATSQWKNHKGIIVKKALECQPCLKRECPLKHHNCMKKIKASDVFEVIDQII